MLLEQAQSFKCSDMLGNKIANNLIPDRSIKY